MNSNILPLPSAPAPLVRSIRESWWIPGEIYMQEHPACPEYTVRTQTFEPLDPALFENLQPPFHAMADQIRNSGPHEANTWTYKVVRINDTLYRETLLNGQVRDRSPVQLQNNPR